MRERFDRAKATFQPMVKMQSRQSLRRHDMAGSPLTGKPACMNEGKLPGLAGLEVLQRLEAQTADKLILKGAMAAFAPSAPKPRPLTTRAGRPRRACR
jgi:hypothetical protein